MLWSKMVKTTDFEFEDVSSSLEELPTSVFYTVRVLYTRLNLFWSYVFQISLFFMSFQAGTPLVFNVWFCFVSGTAVVLIFMVYSLAWLSLCYSCCPICTRYDDIRYQVFHLLSFVVHLGLSLV